MRKRYAITGAVCAAVLVGILVTLCAAQESAARGEPDPPVRAGVWGLLRGAKAKEKLGITEEQQKALRDSWFETRKKTIELTSKLRIARMELENALEEEQIDKKAVEKKVDEIAAVKGELLRAIVAQRIVTKETLKPEQREQIRRIMGERLEKARAKREELQGARERLGRLLPQRPERPLPPEDRRGARAETPSRDEPRAAQIGLVEGRPGDRDPVRGEEIEPADSLFELAAENLAPCPETADDLILDEVVDQAPPY